MSREFVRRALAHPRYCRTLATVVASVVTAASASPAAAQQPLPGNNAGTGQYIEPVPDAEGSRRADPGTHQGRRPLPARTRAALPGGAEGRILERVGTDPGSGAQPAKGQDGARGARSERSAARRAAGEDVGPVAATASSVGDSDDTGARIVVIAVAALMLAAAAAGMLVRRRRRR
jgi:hypothetical protein